jgi:hypothetical protein
MAVMEDKKYLLYHRIGVGGEDSAVVRQYLVERELTASVEFQNIAYDQARAAVEKLVGQVEAPVMVIRADQTVLRGSKAITAWFESQT